MGEPYVKTAAGLAVSQAELTRRLGGATATVGQRVRRGTLETVRVPSERVMVPWRAAYNLIATKSKQLADEWLAELKAQGLL